MNATGKRRLLKLADLLEADAKNKKGMKFDLEIVVGDADNAFGNTYIEEGFQPSVSCGTVGCAMGLAAVSGAFKSAGLSFKCKDNEIQLTWKGRMKYYDDAACKLFDLTNREANFLFSPSWYDCQITGAKGERNVAKRIRNFVAGKIAPPGHEPDYDQYGHDWALQLARVDS